MNARSRRIAVVGIWRLLLGIALSLGLASTWAQSTAANNGSNNTAATGELSEVVVTAQKRSELLENVPIAITVIPAEELAQNSQVLLQDYFGSVPGLSIDDLGTGRVSVTMRGISTGDGGNPTVGITIDEVPIGATNTAAISGAQFVPQLDPGDLDHIEFLKGPQGTLYGATTLGGEIKYVTAAPDLHTPTGSVGVSGQVVDGGGAGYAVRASASDPLIDNEFALRVSFFDRHDPGYIDDPANDLKNVNDRDVYGGLISLLYQPADILSVRLTGLYQKDEIAGDGTIDTNTNLGYSPTFGDLNQYRMPNTGNATYENQAYIATIKVSLEPFDVSSITGYSLADYHETFDVSPFYSYFLSPPGTVVGTNLVDVWEASKFTQEIRLSSFDRGKLDWLVGGFYDFDDNRNNTQTITTNDLATGVPIDSNLATFSFPTKYMELSGFGNATYHFTDQWGLQLGAREARNGQSFYAAQTGSFGVLPVSRTGSHESAFTYLVSPEFKLSKSLLLYGRLSTGYQAGGANAPQPVTIPLEYKSSRTKNYEMGLKSTFLDHRLTIDADVFYIRWTDVQVQGGTPDGSFIFNAGDAKSEGVEFAVNAKPLSSLTLGATFAYTDAVLTNSAGNGFPGVVGNPLPYAMRWNGTLSAEQRFQLAEAVSSFVGATWTYIDKRWQPWPCGTCAEFSLPAYRTLSARAGLEWNLYTLTAFAKNITNERGMVGAIQQPVTPGYDLWGNYKTSIIIPRTIGLSLMKSF
jgi:iron complex outermembrane recepter protein